MWTPTSGETITGSKQKQILSTEHNHMMLLVFNQYVQKKQLFMATIDILQP